MLQRFTKLNGYYQIMFISLTVLIISIMAEQFKTHLPHKKCKGGRLKLYFWRWIHYNITIFTCLFFLFFDVKKFNKDIILYYSLMTLIIMHWYSGFCIITLLECKHYDINIYKEKISSPYLRCIFHRFTDTFISLIFGAGGLLFLYLTFLTKNNPIWFKIPFFILFSCSYYQNYILHDNSKPIKKSLITDCFLKNPYL